jgi:hypothetical protein
MYRCFQQRQTHLQACLFGDAVKAAALQQESKQARKHQASRDAYSVMQGWVI